MFQTGFAQGMHLRLREGTGAAGTILYIHGLGESALCFEGLIGAGKLDD